MLSAHIEVKRHLTERAEDGNVLAKLKACKAYDCELDIAGILIQARPYAGGAVRRLVC